MADITTYPLIDGYETTLAQSWDGNTGDVFLNTLPDFSFPSGVTTYIVVNPGKSNMQVAEIDSMDAANTTVNVSSIAVNKGAGVSYSAQSHGVGSPVRISNNYQFRSDVVDSINSKVDTNDQIDFNYYADATARDADITSPTIGKDYAFLADTGLLYYYGSGGWTAFDTGTATSNATTTVAGLVEIATTTEFDNGTDTGGTGASLIVSPSTIQSALDTIVGDASAGTPDTSADAILFNDSDDSNTRKSRVIDDFRDDIASSTTQKGTVEKATDSEAEAGTDTVRFITPKQAKDNYSNVPTILDGTINAPSADNTNSNTINHGLGREPLYMQVELYENSSSSSLGDVERSFIGIAHYDFANSTYDGIYINEGVNRSVTFTGSGLFRFKENNGDQNLLTVSNVGTTSFDLDFADTGGLSSSINLRYRIKIY